MTVSKQEKMKVATSEDVVRRRLLRGGVWVAAGRLGGTGLAFLAVVLLARFLSSEDFGAYLLFVNVIALLAIPARCGLGRAMVRFIASKLENDPGQARHTLFLGLKIALITICATAILSVVLGYLFGESLFGHTDLGRLLLYGAVGVGVFALLQIMADSLRGFHRLSWASIVDATKNGPLIYLVFVVLILCYAFFAELTFLSATALYVLALGIVVPIAGVCLFREAYGVSPDDQSSSAADSTVISTSTILAFCLPVALVNLLAFASSRADIFIAGVSCSHEELAIYGVARRVVPLVAIPLTVVRMTVLSTIPDLWAHQKLLQLERILQAGATLALLPTMLGVLLLILAPGLILGTIFGDAYRMAAIPLVLLGFGQLVSTWTGPCQQLLIMTGRQRYVLGVNAVTAAGLFVGGSLAARVFGPVGLALVYCIVFATSSLLTWYLAKKYTGIRTNATLDPAWISSLIESLRTSQRRLVKTENDSRG